MNRVTVIAMGWLVLASIAQAGQGASGTESDELQHDWEEHQKGGEIALVSNYPAPVPFSMSGEPEATLALDSGKVSGKDTLKKIVDREVSEIRKQIQIADYEEEDGKHPVDGIATYYEDIEGVQVAFIKYRGKGIIGKPAGLPRTASMASSSCKEGSSSLT